MKKISNACILIYNYGGPSHLDTLDLKPTAPAEISGEFQPIATSVAGTSIGEHLPRLAAQKLRLSRVRAHPAEPIAPLTHSLTHPSLPHLLTLFVGRSLCAASHGFFRFDSPAARRRRTVRRIARLVTRFRLRSELKTLVANGFEELIEP